MSRSPITLSDYPRLSFEEILEAVPALRRAAEAHWEADSLAETCEDLEFILLPGNLTLDAAVFGQLVGDYSARLVVQGDVHVEGRARRFFYVGGDLYCNSIILSDAWPDVLVAGRIVASDCAQVFAEDDTRMCLAGSVRLDTPFLFAWYYNIDAIVLPPETVIFILGEFDYCDNLALPNPVFVWHDCVHVLAERLHHFAVIEDINVHGWDFPAIEAALLQGESIYRDGFDIACYPWMQAGDEAIALGERHRAYQLYCKAAAISPAYDVAWLGMANALMWERALEQALPVYMQAAELFPENQISLQNFACNMAAMCAIRCRQLDLAVQLAGRSIAHNADSSDAGSARAPAYRFRAEALILLGHEEEALADLKRAIEYDEYQSMAHWLQGLILHRQGDSAGAAAAYESGKVGRRSPLPAFAEQDSTDFLAGPLSVVDWDHSHASLPLRDEAYWRRLMRNQSADRIARVPVAFRGADMLGDLLANMETAHEWNFLTHFPAEAFTRAHAERVVSLSASNLSYLPCAMIDRSLCLLASTKRGSLDLSLVPEEGIDHELCTHAVRSGTNLVAIPARFVDHELCMAAVLARASNIADVPADLLDDALIATALAYSSDYAFENDLPGYFKQAHLLSRAVRDHKQALDTIPGYLFDEVLFAVARETYGADADWNDILARHGQAACTTERYRSPELVCWLVFWDEAFLLEHIAKKSRYLSPWHIPAHRFTAAVAQACFAAHPIHLDKIPAQFVREAMCTHFSMAYADDLECIPVAFRTAPVCAAAVAERPQNLHLVPLALRSVQLCVAALRAKPDLYVAIPKAVYRQVFEAFLERPGTLRQGWIRVQRAECAVAAGDLEEAFEDYTYVLSEPTPAGVTDDDLVEARYGIGYVHYRRGELAQAAEWRRLAPTFYDYDVVEDSQPVDPIDFDWRRFDAVFNAHDAAMAVRDYELALVHVSDAEQMLAAASSIDYFRWSRVIDSKRALCALLERWELERQTCRTALHRMSDDSTWHHGSDARAIAETLDQAHAYFDGRAGS